MRQGHRMVQQTSKPSERPKPKPPQAINVTVHHVRQPSQAVEEVRRAIAADPCGTLGHRWAWLTAGGQECVQCGARR